VLALVWILAPALVIAMGALLCLILGLFYILYLNPLLEWLTRKEGGFFKRLVFWPVRKAAEAVRRFARGHIAALFRAYINRSAPLVHLVNNFTELTQRLAGSLGDNAEATYKALYQLRHDTIPALLQAKVEPIWNRIAVLSDRLGVTEGRIQDAGQLITGTLTRLPWGAPVGFVPALEAWLGSYRHLWNQTFNFIQPRVNDIYLVKLPDIWDRLAALEAGVGGKLGNAIKAIQLRLGKIEKSLEGILTDPTTWVLTALGLALVPALGAGGFRSGLGNLFCRNVQATSKSICAQNELMWAQLLAGTLLFALVLDPRALARVAEGVTATLDGVIRQTVLR